MWPYLFQSPLRERRAFHVLDGPNLIRQLLALFPLQRRQALFREGTQRLPVLAQVDLGAHEDDGRVRAVVLDLGVPLGSDILEGRRTGHAEADQEHVLQIHERIGLFEQKLRKQC